MPEMRNRKFIKFYLLQPVRGETVKLRDPWLVARDPLAVSCKPPGPNILAEGYAERSNRDPTFTFHVPLFTFLRLESRAPNPEP